MKYNGQQKERAIGLAKEHGNRAASRMTGVSLSAIKVWVKASEEFELKLKESFKTN